MKQNYLKQLFTLLLLLCTVVTTSKAETDLYDGEKFCVDELGYRVISATERTVASAGVLNMEKPSGSISIPDYVTYKGYELTVIEIDNGTFSGCTELESVVIGNKVKRIGQDAFRECTELASVTIGNSVTIIGAGAFHGCNSLTSFVIPGNVEIIDNNAFYECNNLENITMSYGVKEIGTQAFCGCKSLDNVVIPSSVTIIEHKAFFRCSSLTSIDIPGSVETIVATAFYDCPLLKTVTIREGVKSIGGEAFACCVSLTEIEIPNSVTSIGNTAFASCSALESVTIGDGTETIGDFAFNGCTSLTDLTIGDNVKSIGNSAFSGCTGLRSIELPNSVTEIKESAFRSCSSLTSITIPENVASIGEHTFSDCSGLTSITSLIPKEDLFAINSNAFNSINKNSCILYVPYGAKETYASTAGWKEFTNIVELEPDVIGGTCGANVNWTLADGVLTITGTGAMDNSSSPLKTPWYEYRNYIQSVVIENGVTSIGDYAFGNCSNLTSVVIPNGVTSIGDGAFRYCTSLASVVIPQGVTTLGVEAFISCSALTAIEIPSSVTSIGECAFHTCTALTRVDSKIPAEKLFAINSNVFQNVNSTCTIYVPIGAQYKYAEIGGWNVYVNIVKDVPAHDGQCGADAYWLYEAETKTLTIFGVGSTDDYDYGKSPWYTNKNVANVVIQDGITGLGKYTFQFYNGLRSVTMSNSVTSIGYGAFVDCTNLTRIEFSNNLTTIGENAFNNCIALEGVVIPSSVTSITENTFYNCRSLGSIVVAEGNTVYDSRNDCNAIIKSADNALVVGSNNTVIPDGITSIGNYAFGGRQRLTAIEIPSRVTSIGSEAFYDCDGLTSIEIPAGVTSIGSEAFYDCDGLTSVKSLIPADNLFEIPADVFNEVNKDACTLYVPFGAKEAYAKKSGWNYFTNVDVWLPFENITITIGQYGSTTYCCEYPLDFSNVVGLKAYAATGYNTATQVITLVRLNTAKEGTGLFIKGKPGEYTVPVIKQSNDYTLNMLVGTVNEITVNSTTEDGAYANFKYTTLPSDETPMFYRFEDNTSLPAHKAYLQLPAALFPSSASKSVSLRFDDGETTDIDEVEGEVADVETVYDLQGRVVENPAKGIYIVDGKKVFINK